MGAGTAGIEDDEYTAKGMAMAKKEAKKTGKPMKKAVKKVAMKKMGKKK